MKKQYRVTWLVNFLIGGTLTWPLGVYVGRRMTRYQGGTPIVPYNRIVWDYVNLDPTKHARSTFRFYWMLTCAAGGFLFATFTVSDKFLINKWYNRPDLKPFPAMVAKDDMDVTEKTIYEHHY